MGVIKRADGTVVCTGTHVGSRGSLASIRHGGGEDFSEGLSDEDKEWEIRVLASATTFGESSLYQEDDDYETEELELISTLWGVYQGECPHLNRQTFNEKFFIPAR